MRHPARRFDDGRFREEHRTSTQPHPRNWGYKTHIFRSVSECYERFTSSEFRHRCFGRPLDVDDDRADFEDVGPCL